MGYEIDISESALSELKGLRVYDQRRIATEIHGQLSNQPTVTTRNKKCLSGVSPDFEHVAPVWELRVGMFRVFYDVDEASLRVSIRAVREKAADKQTKDIT